MAKKPPKPAIVLLDIETSPNLGYVWGKWQQDVIEFDKEWHILCFAYKWLGDKKAKIVALPDFAGYAKDKENDRKVVEKLHDILTKADVVIAHNGDGFDIPKINTRFVYHGIRPPEPFKTVDTCRIAKSKFGFTSNKLDDIGRYLRVGRKMKHGGFDVWRGCMAGDKGAWNTMKRYNVQDVHLLEQVYLKLRPWMTNHPNLNAYTGTDACPKCQGWNLRRQGYKVLVVGKRQQFQCKDCGAWSYGKIESSGIIIR